MIAVVLFALSLLLEFQIQNVKRDWIHYLGLVVLLVLGSVSLSYFPLALIAYLYFIYGIFHFQFLKVEWGFGLMVSSVFAMLGILSLYCPINLLLIVAFLIFSLLEYIQMRILKREENKTIIYQNKLLKQQMDEIETIYMTMRGWRHDYHNHLQSLKGYLKLGQIEEGKDYLDKLEDDLKSIDTLYHSGNLQIDAILNSKLAIAEQDRIRLTCDAQVPPLLSVNEIDLCVIIGNLLDNAIESCRKIEKEEERFIRVYIGVLKKQLYISITNATKESVRVRTDQYFTNKRGDHGHGLRRVDLVVKKYEGYLNRQNEPGVFATEIILPL